MNSDPVIIIGGTPRVIGQVRDSKKRGKVTDDMNVGQILEKSRANRLLLKEHEKNVSHTIARLMKGNLANKFVELPNADWRDGEFHKVKGAYEIAKNIELDYAQQAADLGNNRLANWTED